MAITKVGAMTDPPVAGDYTILQAKLDAYAKQIGNQGMILTQWTNTIAVPKIAMGSYITHGGTLFVVDTEDFAVSSPAGDGTYYLKVAASGDTLAVSWVASLSGYTWNAIYNGLYHSDESQILPYQLVKAGAIRSKRKITNLMQGSGFVTVNYMGNVLGSANFDVTGAIGGASVAVTGAIGGASLVVTGAISGTSINTGLGAFLIGQNLRTTDNVSFGNINPPVDNNDDSLPAIGIGGFTFGYKSTKGRFTMPTGGIYMVIGIHSPYTTIERVSGGSQTTNDYTGIAVFRLS